MNRNMFFWALYDFANSIILIVFLFYFSQWLVIDSGKPDWWYNAVLAASSVFFVFIAPFLAQRLDIVRHKLRGLQITTALTIFFHLGTAVIVLFTPEFALAAVVLFTFAASSYLLSYVYYTPMINDLATAENKAFVSGVGMCANYVGQVIGLIAVLPFANGFLYIIGSPGRAQTLLPAVILFTLFALPMLFRYKDTAASSSQASMRMSAVRAFQALNRIASIQGLLFLIIGYFFFSDALLTFANNFPIYLEKVYAVSDSTKTYLTAGILTMAAIGAVVIGKIADKTGRKKTLVVLLTCWSALFTTVAIASSFHIAAVIMLIAGLLYGATWGVSRAMVGDLAPSDIEASAFSWYTLAERFATFVGPLTWTLVLSLTAHHGIWSYKYAVISMGTLVVVGLIFVLKVQPRSPQGTSV